MAQAAIGLNQLALYVNPVRQRRDDFQRVCGEQFERIELAEGAAHAGTQLAAHAVDLLIIDLEACERRTDLAAIGDLIVRRAGLPILVLCPFANAAWLSALMQFGPLAYAITPLPEAELLAVVTAQRHASNSGAAQVEQLREQLAAAGRLHDAIAAESDYGKLAEQICAAMCALPGVSYAALLQQREDGVLRLEAQHSPAAIDLYAILHRYDGLLHSRQGQAFPALFRACANDMLLLDAPAKSGEPALAVALQDGGVEMLLGLPLPADRSGQARGALCLMFAQARSFSGDELASLARLAQLAGIGLTMGEINRDSQQLASRLTQLATTDALTGLANRRHGEYLLELEVRRARRYKVPLSVISLDIDRFKAVNDQYGHPVGDAVLRIVAEVTQAGLRNSDVLVRSGGEEFLVIAPHTSAVDALKMAEKVRAVIANASIPGCDRVTISLGVGQLSEEESADSLTRRVEVALARAKRAGRNCVELATR